MKNNFEVGDFVRHKLLGTVHEVQSINGGEFGNKISVTFSPSFDGGFMTDYEKWYPKFGEYVWYITVHGSVNLMTYIRKLSETTHQCKDMSGGTYNTTNIQPFFGKPPKI